MKTIITSLIILLSVNVLAKEVPTPCRTMLTYEDSREQCAKAILFNWHQDVYYSARVYLISADQVKEQIIKAIDEYLLEEMRLSYGDYKKKLEQADYIMLVIEENDMPYVSMNIISNRNGSEVISLMPNTSIDWFSAVELEEEFYEQPETIFGFNKNNLVDSFSF